MMEHASTWDQENFNGTPEPDLGDRDPTVAWVATGYGSYGDPVPWLEDHPHLVTMVIKSPQTGLSMAVPFSWVALINPTYELVVMISGPNIYIIQGQISRISAIKRIL